MEQKNNSNPLAFVGKGVLFLDTGGLLFKKPAKVYGRYDLMIWQAQLLWWVLMKKFSNKKSKK